MSQWRYIRVRRTTLICLGCASFLVGLGTTRFGVRQSSGWLMVIALALLVLCRQKVLWRAVPAVILCGTLLGVWRGSVVQNVLDRFVSLIGQKVTLQGTVSDDVTYGSKGQAEIRLQQPYINVQPMIGSVRVTTIQQVFPQRGDTITAIGTLRPGFGAYQAEALYATVQVVSRTASWPERFRRLFSASVLTYLPEPQASLGLGFLIGLKAQLPKTLNDQLQVLGLTHIVVASGYNLTVLVRAARRLLAKRSKYQMTVLSSLLIAGFLAITGFSSSMSRAALVSSLSLLAWYYGRQIHPAVLLLVSAAVTAAASPLFLWSDVGWYLSFLSFAGVMLLEPLVIRRLYGTREPSVVTHILIETTCAQVMTLPLILFTFGQFSVLALVANLLIEPFIPLAMLLTFVAGMAGLLAPMLAPWLGLPPTWLLGYMTGLSGWLSRIPWAQALIAISASSMVASYACLAVLTAILLRKTGYDYIKPG